MIIDFEIAKSKCKCEFLVDYLAALDRSESGKCLERSHCELLTAIKK